MGIYAIGLIAHGGAGKTTLGEAMLHAAGTIPKMGSVDDGTTVLDSEPEEKAHKTSIVSSLASTTPSLIASR